uniref:Uncharacterized protein n=1 Tax=Amphimedon queenslandica TaxID=400682 RepID=A0A1X7VN70_AMPQE
MVGYISDDEVYHETNPFRLILTGVIWLVRNGTNNVNKNMWNECSCNSRCISMNKLYGLSLVMMIKGE